MTEVTRPHVTGWLDPTHSYTNYICHLNPQKDTLGREGPRYSHGLAGGKTGSGQVKWPAHGPLRPTCPLAAAPPNLLVLLFLPGPRVSLGEWPPWASPQQRSSLLPDSGPSSLKRRSRKGPWVSREALVCLPRWHCGMAWVPRALPAPDTPYPSPPSPASPPWVSALTHSANWWDSDYLHWPGPHSHISVLGDI